MTVEDLLSWAVPEADKCREAAAGLLASGPGGEEAARRALVASKKWAMAAGGATGMFASPLTMIPAALADMSAMLRIEAAMAGTIGAILDPTSLDEPAVFRADVLTIIFPAAISQAMRQVGVHAAQVLTRQLIRKYVIEGLFEAASQVAARRLALHVGERAIALKTVPLVGAGLGAGWNWLEVQAVGDRAIRYYLHGDLGPGMLRQGAQRFSSWAKKLLKKSEDPTHQEPEP